MKWQEPPEINDRYQPLADILVGAVIIAGGYLLFCVLLPALGAP